MGKRLSEEALCTALTGQLTWAEANAGMLKEREGDGFYAKLQQRQSHKEGLIYKFWWRHSGALLADSVPTAVSDAVRALDVAVGCVASDPAPGTDDGTRVSSHRSIVEALILDQAALLLLREMNLEPE